MSGFEMEMPDSIDSGDFVREPGTYHFAVLEVDEQPTSKAGQLLDGFRADVEVLAGPFAKKQAELMFFKPKLTDKNGGEMAKRKQARFALATGIIPEAKPGERVTVDLSKAKGRQFIATLAHRADQNDPNKKYIDLNFADIWHVDDPSAPKCELNQQALGLLPKSLRKTPESFAAASGNGSASGNGAAKSSTAASATAAASAPASLDDL